MGRVKDWLFTLEQNELYKKQTHTSQLSTNQPSNPMVENQKTDTIRASVLLEAIKIVTQDRNNTYGGPEDSFKTIANLWSAYTGHTYSTGDVAIFLSLLKIARLKNSPYHRDSWVDLAGYAACGAECSLKIK